MTAATVLAVIGACAPAVAATPTPTASVALPAGLYGTADPTYDGVWRQSLALLTGGVGPWLPFQMLAMGWFTMGAGLLPGRAGLRGRAERALLALYGFLGAFAYGTAMNLAGWPFMGTLASGVAFDPDAAVPANVARFVAYCVATSLGWDLGRAVVTVVLTLTVGPAILRALRRATRRAAFEAPVTFDAPAP